VNFYDPSGNFIFIPPIVGAIIASPVILALIIPEAIDLVIAAAGVSGASLVGNGPGAAVGTIAGEFVRANLRLMEDLESLSQRLTEMEASAAQTNLELEQLLEELRAMFPPCG